VAAVVRLWDIGGAPPGIWIDEGRLGWWAIRFLNGESWWAMPEGPEPLGLFLAGLAFKWFGATLVVGRCAMAVAGTLTVPVLWWCLRPVYGAEIAVAAAACCALSRWHILVSRLGAPYVLLPLGFLLAVGTLVRAWRARRTGDWAVAGACLGASLYTYQPARACPLILAGALVWAAWRRPRERPACAHVAAWGLSALVVAVPYLVHLWQVPAARTLRFLDVAGPFLAAPVRAGARQCAQTLAAVTVRGDGHVTFAFPFAGDWPAVGVAGIALLLIGLPRIGRGVPAWWNAALGLAALAYLVVGTVTGFSHVRSVHLIPVICLAQACGLVRIARAMPRAVAAALLAGLAVQEAGGFFTPRLRWADPAAVEAEYHVAIRSLVDRVAGLAHGAPVYLSSETARPSLPYEWLVADQLFLIHRWVRPEPVPSPAALRRAHGVVLSIVNARARLEILEDLVPGGRLEIVEGPWYRGAGQGLYLMGPDLVPKAPFAEIGYLVGRHEALQDLCTGGRDREGLAEADRLVARWPAVAGFRVWRAYFRQALDRHAAVEGDLERALALMGGRSSRALMLLGLAAARRGDYQEAIRRWEACARLDPVNDAVWHDLGAAYLRLGDAAGAEGAALRARFWMPRSAAAAALSPVVEGR
jgi:hypothetical protein